MGEKYYKPIIKDGDHILRSKTNPNRVRGLTRDVNNSNPDIIEWEEVEVDTNDESDTYEGENFQPSLEQEQLATAIANFLIVSGTLFVGKVIVPWWNKTAWPWVRNRAKDLRGFFRKNNDDKTTNRICDSSNIVGPVPSQYVDISSMIDSEFESIYIDMDKEEANKHIMKLVYHMLGVANEIRILSISQIKNECESDEIYIEHSKETKTYLAQKVAANIDRLLSDEDLHLDANTSQKLFSLTGGGIRISGEYIPVQIDKIEQAMSNSTVEQIN